MTSRTPPTDARGEPVRLLVADDDARVRRALVTLLDNAPEIAVVGGCGDATTARNLAQELGPDLALVDVLLPRAVDGLGLVGDLVAEGIPVVGISARDGVRDRVLAAGATAFLGKDGDPDQVIVTVLSVARGRTCPAE